MVHFLNGMASAAALIAGVLFCKFWRETRDRLFMWFAFAFWIFAINWALLATVSLDERLHYLFVIRLAGFCLILASVIEKNRGASDRRR